MRKYSNKFLLIPRKIITETFDSISTKVEWKWFINVNKVTNIHNGSKNISLWLKNCPEL